MAEPDEAAVILAMKSDLGAGRVDDLELSDGRPGHAVRPSNIHQNNPAQAKLPPAKIQAASKWQTAIKQGAFDDDDADAVKNLERLGGGRLHAKPSVEAFTGRQTRFNLHFNPASLFGFASSRMPARMPGSFPSSSPESSRHASMPNYGNKAQNGAGSKVSSLGIVSNGPVQRLDPGKAAVAKAAMSNTTPKLAQPTQPAPAPPSRAPPSRAPPSRAPSTSVPSTPERTKKQPQETPSQPETKAQPNSPAARLAPPDAPYTDDLEPKEWFHKSDIVVADLRAKGRGRAFLIAATDAAPCKFSIFLEGQPYLEYPLERMVNYMANSEGLCPQFIEEDGVSVTTTCLIFRSQAEIANFMKAVKILKAKKEPPKELAATPKSAPEAAKTNGNGAVQSTKTLDPTVTPSKPAKPLAEKDKKPAETAAPAPAKKTDPAVQKSAIENLPKPRQEEPPQMQVTTQARIRPPPGLPPPGLNFSQKPPEHLQNESKAVIPAKDAMTTDLLDLSSPSTAEDTPVSPPPVSSYTTDLGSLDDFSVKPIPGSFNAESALPASTFTGTAAATETVKTAGTSDTSETLDASDTSEATMQVTVSTPADVNSEMAIVKTDDQQVARQGVPTETRAQLKTYLDNIMPQFEEMIKILTTVDNDDRLEAVKEVFSEHQEESGESLDSEKNLLIALFQSAQGQPTPKALPAPVQRRAYSAKEILTLRDKATTPPSKFDTDGFRSPNQNGLRQATSQLTAAEAVTKWVLRTAELAVGVRVTLGSERWLMWLLVCFVAIGVLLFTSLF